MPVQRGAVGLAACTVRGARLRLVGAGSAAGSQGRKERPPAKQEAAVATRSAEPTLVGQFGTWGATFAAPGGRQKVCFTLAKPSTRMKTSPPNRPRDPAYAFVSIAAGGAGWRRSSQIMIELSAEAGFEGDARGRAATAMPCTRRAIAFGSGTQAERGRR